jgi:hypothetical protein
MPNRRSIFTFWATFLLGILLTMAYNAMAQEVKTVLTVDRSEPTPVWFEYCQADKGLVTISQANKSSNRSVVLFKYDGSFQRQWQVELFQQNGNITVENLTVLDDRIYIFIAEKLIGKKQVVTTYFVIGLDGKLIVNGQQLYTGEDNGVDVTNFRFDRSLNKRRLLAYHSYLNGTREDQMIYFQFHADSAPNAPKRGLVTLPYADQDLQVKHVKVGNLGTVFLLAKLVKSARQRNPEDVRWLLFKQNQHSQQVLEYPLDLQGQFVSDLTCKPDREENLVVSGFYSSSSSSQLSGVLFARLGKNDTLYNFKASPFKETFLARYLTQRQMEKGRGLADFFMDDIVLRSDGGALILAEQYYLTSTSYPDLYGFWQTVDTYNYDDVLTISIDPDGLLEWVAVVEKTQQGEQAGELSYFSVVGPEDIYIFYKTRSDDGMNVFFSKVSYDGTVEPPRPFFKEPNVNDTFYRQYCEQVTNRDALLAYYSSKLRSFKLLKVGF